MQSHIKLNVCSIHNGRSAPGAYPGEGRYFEIGTPLLMSYSRGHTLQLTCRMRRATRRAGLVTRVSEKCCSVEHVILHNYVCHARVSEMRNTTISELPNMKFFTLGKFRRLTYFCLHSILSNLGGEGTLDPQTLGPQNLGPHCFSFRIWAT